ncbi:hypothetical protein [Pleomorphomonas sp. JP5]|uniref:hypothetical protein n=1 Tax=Pleomorphomonas sp. JP5 TaxID=2942998 RepID=UPI002043744A|nr:hypothetical protein [Pleomorphomonas sp. JP5]MCM5557231.1 hypothetical protein [Pleomorphomonas sp. JP5]
MKLFGFVVAAIATFLLGAAPSLAGARLNAFRDAKTLVLQTPSNYLNPEGWTSFARERLISSIDGTWIELRDLDLDGDVDLAKACQEKPIRMRKIDDYSFSMVIDYQSPKGKMDYRAEYINRRGASYAIRNDFRARSKMLGPDAPAAQKEIMEASAAMYANQDAILLPLGPDVLLEFRGQDGFPELYGRCE